MTITLANDATGTFDRYIFLTATAVNGVAIFTNLEIDTAGTYELEATSTGLIAGISTSITITPAAPTQLLWVADPRARRPKVSRLGPSLSWKIGTGTLRPT